MLGSILSDVCVRYEDDMLHNYFTLPTWTKQTHSQQTTVAKCPRFNHNGSSKGADFGKLGQILIWAPPGKAIAEQQNWNRPKYNLSEIGYHNQQPEHD